MNELCEIERGGSPRPIKSFLTNDADGINWIKIGDTKNVTKYIFKTKEKIRPEGVKRSRMVYEGDFILSNSMSFGHPYIMKTTGCIHDGWLVLRERTFYVNKDYLYLVLGSDLIFKQFDQLAAGSTVRNLNIGLVKGVEIPLPPSPNSSELWASLIKHLMKSPRPAPTPKKISRTPAPFLKATFNPSLPNKVRAGWRRG